MAIVEHSEHSETVTFIMQNIAQHHETTFLKLCFYVFFVELSALHTNGGQDWHQIIGAEASKLLKTLEKLQARHMRCEFAG